MAKVRSLSELQDALDVELSWRIYELSHLKRMVSSESEKKRVSLVRAGITMLYAHWEGFIKEGTSYYLEFVSRKKLKQSEVSKCFSYLSIRSKMEGMYSASRPGAWLGLAREIDSILNGVEVIVFPTTVNTKSNLNSDIFAGIVSSIGVDVSRYEAYYNLIDESLLAKRNSIAHGQYLDINAESFDEIYGNVLMLMRWFKTDIENAASTYSYMKVPPIS